MFVHILNVFYVSCGTLIIDDGVGRSAVLPAECYCRLMSTLLHTDELLNVQM